MDDQDRISGMRRQAWRGALDAFATGYMFEHRQRQLRWNLRRLSFVGLAVPLIVGTAVLTFGVASSSWVYVLWMAGILGAAQVVISLWALVARWEESLSHASESASANHDLSKRFRAIAENPPELASFSYRLDMLLAENMQREQADYRQDLTDAEKRRGHRAALRHFDKKCKGCDQVPTSLKSTDCEICGNF
jgi:mobilome CxxCx(11)CxxC protein